MSSPPREQTGCCGSSNASKPCGWDGSPEQQRIARGLPVEHASGDSLVSASRGAKCKVADHANLSPESSVRFSEHVRANSAPAPSTSWDLLKRVQWDKFQTVVQAGAAAGVGGGALSLLSLHTPMGRRFTSLHDRISIVTISTVVPVLLAANYARLYVVPPKSRVVEAK